MPVARVKDAHLIAQSWLSEISLSGLIQDRLADTTLIGQVDVVALGKASREMFDSLREILGSRLGRHFIVCDRDSASRDSEELSVRVGEHPLPGAGSVAAARELVEFLEAGSESDTTLFAISGGASSLCNLSQHPMTMEDLASIWQYALRGGVDITTLNRLRAATSQIAGGLILRHVRTATSMSLIMVDNVVSGAEWVASGLTYDATISDNDLDELLERFHIPDGELRRRIVEAAERRSINAKVPVTTNHTNTVLAEPSLMLNAAISTAKSLGYRVYSLGASVTGEASSVAKRMCKRAASVKTPEPFCVIGAGEVTIALSGNGVGGRCQEMAWAAAPWLERLQRRAGFVAHASDGRDHVAGVAGAWADNKSMSRINDEDFNYDAILEDHDTLPALSAIGQLIPGEHTGWNLCDLYVVCVGQA